MGGSLSLYVETAQQLAYIPRVADWNNTPLVLDIFACGCCIVEGVWLNLRTQYQKGGKRGVVSNKEEERESMA